MKCFVTASFSMIFTAIELYTFNLLFWCQEFCNYKTSKVQVSVTEIPKAEVFPNSADTNEEAENQCCFSCLWLSI